MALLCLTLPSVLGTGRRQAGVGTESRDASARDSDRSLKPNQRCAEVWINRSTVRWSRKRRRHRCTVQSKTSRIDLGKAVTELEMECPWIRQARGDGFDKWSTLTVPMVQHVEDRYGQGIDLSAHGHASSRTDVREYYDADLRRDRSNGRRKRIARATWRCPAHFRNWLFVRRRPWTVGCSLKHRSGFRRQANRSGDLWL